MRGKDKFTVERSHPSKTPPLPEAVTKISWDELVGIIAAHGIFIAKRIRYANDGFSGGTREIDGSDMLALWKEVERKRRKEGSPTPASPTTAAQ
jgi:hypothetical protein